MRCKRCSGWARSVLEIVATAAARIAKEVSVMGVGLILSVVATEWLLAIFARFWRPDAVQCGRSERENRAGWPDFRVVPKLTDIRKCPKKLM